MRARQVLRVFVFFAFFSALHVPFVAFAVPAQGHKIMEAGPNPLGAQIARDITAKGGNVVDVTVAVTLAMAVMQPYFASFGGGGFALINIDGHTEALDFREMAPKKSSETLFKDRDTKSSRTGGLATAVPGIPAGLWEMHHKYGKLKWNALFDAAIDLAEKGFPVSGEWASMTEENLERFDDTAKKFFTLPDGKALKPGDVLKQPKLAMALKALKKDGAKA
ncbi:MAG: gamma-glutamyltransferase, partial [Verrucomicrobiota bacterium]